VAKQRLMTMRETTDGFEIARRDLEIRGPGEFLGARQSGEAMLRFANLETDQWIVEQARDVAAWLLGSDKSGGGGDRRCPPAALAGWARGVSQGLKIPACPRIFERRPTHF
jgi:RecG-like helicase